MKEPLSEIVERPEPMPIHVKPLDISPADCKNFPAISLSVVVLSVFVQEFAIFPAAVRKSRKDTRVTASKHAFPEIEASAIAALAAASLTATLLRLELLHSRAHRHESFVVFLGPLLEYDVDDNTKGGDHDAAEEENPGRPEDGAGSGSGLRSDL